MGYTIGSRSQSFHRRTSLGVFGIYKQSLQNYIPRTGTAKRAKRKPLIEIPRNRKRKNAAAGQKAGGKSWRSDVDELADVVSEESSVVGAKLDRYTPSINPERDLKLAKHSVGKLIKSIGKGVSHGGKKLQGGRSGGKGKKLAAKVQKGGGGIDSDSEEEEEEEEEVGGRGEGEKEEGEREKEKGVALDREGGGEEEREKLAYEKREKRLQEQFGVKGQKGRSSQESLTSPPPAVRSNKKRRRKRYGGSALI